MRTLHGMHVPGFPNCFIMGKRRRASPPTIPTC